jgi:hypothetical protein
MEWAHQSQGWGRCGIKKFATRFFASGLVTTPALELPPHVVHPPAQPFNSAYDIADIIAGDRSWAIGEHGRRIGLAPHVQAVRQAIPLVAQAQAVPEPEVGAAAIGIAPEGRGILSDGRDRDEIAKQRDMLVAQIGTLNDSTPGWLKLKIILFYAARTGNLLAH